MPLISLYASGVPLWSPVLTTRLALMMASARPVATVLALPPPPTTATETTAKDKWSEDELPVCRICHCSDDSEIVTMVSDATVTDTSESVVCSQSVEPAASSSLISPCFCSGSLRYVHHYCLQQWIRSSNHKYCELCKFHFKLTVKSKPLHKVSDRSNDDHCLCPFFSTLSSKCDGSV